MKDSCSNCRFFNKELDAEALDGGVMQIGACRRHSKSMNKYGVFSWPNVTGDDWCGDHQPVPNQDADYVIHVSAVDPQAIIEALKDFVFSEGGAL